MQNKPSNAASSSTPELPATRFGRLQAWAWSPIIVLRVALMTTYLLHIYFAVIAFIAGVPVFNLTTPVGYTPIWASILMLAALFAAIGSIADRWSVIEKWASLVLSACMLAYVGGVNLVGWAEGDITRQAGGGALAITLVLPFCRFIWLAAQTGKSKGETA